MPSPAFGRTPSLSTFLKSLKTNDLDSSIELFISLLKRRQIRDSWPCALATTHLLLQLVAADKTRDAHVLIQRIRDIGRTLIAAQPRELAVGNVVRRVLAVVREVAEDDRDANAVGEMATSAPKSPISAEGAQRPPLPTNISSFSPLHDAAALPHDVAIGEQHGTTQSGGNPGHRPSLLTSQSSYAGQAPPVTSLFNILQHPQKRTTNARMPTDANLSTLTRPQRKSQNSGEAKEKLDVKAEVLDGIRELLEELEIVDNQIAESALDLIHSNDIILTHTSSQTIQKFLITAARKRKFTVIHAEAYPIDHDATHATIINGGQKTSGDDEDVEVRWRPLTTMGITVVLISDAAVFALMSRINKVILAPHSVLANGSLLAVAGASTIAQAAKTHHVPVIVLSGVYKLSPVYPFDTAELIERGDPSQVIPYQDRDFLDNVDILNPLYDWVDSDFIDLYITNLGGHAPSYLYRIVADHYRTEDIDLSLHE